MQRGVTWLNKSSKLLTVKWLLQIAFHVRHGSSICSTVSWVSRFPNLRFIREYSHVIIIVSYWAELHTGLERLLTCCQVIKQRKLILRCFQYPGRELWGWVLCDVVYIYARIQEAKRFLRLTKRIKEILLQPVAKSCDDVWSCFEQTEAWAENAVESWVCWVWAEFDKCTEFFRLEGLDSFTRDVIR
jgi:hypothetical protein